ncbi:MAG TPA: histidine kinase dimerization/phosphoacceptor domain -containing protein [Caulobacteraceae bacterium]|jgi:two-component sensor histidine kinase|nr:histidine kinase dimerization/phosphoacceptor domain -containing protein [Caulobacteraceae bacterium]
MRARLSAIPRLPNVQHPVAQAALGLGLIAGATALRYTLMLGDPTLVPFALYFPAALAAAVVGGWTAGGAAIIAALLASLALSSSVLSPVSARDPFSIVVFTLCATATVWAGAYVRTLVRDLRNHQAAMLHRTLTYDTLFSTITEGFAICEAVRDRNGRLVDYVVEEMNPALRRMLGLPPGATRGRLSDAQGDFSQWLAVCDRVLTDGQPAAFEREVPETGRWQEIRVSRLTGTKMAQLFIDITRRKRDQARQAELFDELNHRVKNNLAIVSGMLSTQARIAEPTAGEQLLKAVARVHSIADLHASLYKTHQSRDVDLGAYLVELCDNLSRSLVADDRIAIRVDAPSFTTSVDHAVPLGLIVSELVTNALKYAYAPDEDGEILVKLARDGAGASLVIQDFGRGLPDVEAEDMGTGLGSRLVRSMVQQVGGELNVTSQDGARIEIRLPASEVAATRH